MEIIKTVRGWIVGTEPENAVQGVIINVRIIVCDDIRMSVINAVVNNPQRDAGARVVIPDGGDINIDPT